MNERLSSQRFLALPFGLWAVLFIVLPLFFVLWNGLKDVDGGFTLVHLQTVLQAGNYRG